MFLVFGCFGVGCIFLFSVFVNNWFGYEKVIGEVRYGNMFVDEVK